MSGAIRFWTRKAITRAIYRDIQWKNKTITELYYPGSVFKVITAAMGLDSGHATLNTTLNCSGAYTIAKQTYHCAGKKAHGVQNLADGPAEQLQHLLHPAGPAGGFQPLLRLL